MELVFLWTDYGVYFLMLLAFFVAYKIISSAHLRKIWQHIFYRPINLTAGIVLLIFVLIGVLDSIHFNEKTTSSGQPSLNGVVSLLDKILLPIALHKERSYSAPFAIVGFTKETLTSQEGIVTRTYPRLHYAGTHLKNPSQHAKDIQHRFYTILFETGIIASMLSILFIAWGAYRSSISFETFFSLVLKGRSIFPWRTAILLIYLVSFVGIFVSDFIPYYHILGTTQIGEDVLYQSLKSIRTGLVIGTLTTLVMLPFAVFFGIIAGYFRGWIDDIIQYIYTTLSSIPGVLLIAAAVLAMQMVMDRHSEWFQTMVMRADARLLILCSILGITSWTSLCRFMRAETLKLSQTDYVQAAYSLGVSHLNIIFKHILPNVAHIILITVALDFSGLVLAEAVLSYVGVGVDPTTYSWGMMINSARLEMARLPMVWWNLVAAFIFMFTMVLSANVFSDAVRDAFDPHYRGAV